MSQEDKNEVYEFRPRVMIVVLSSKEKKIEDDFDAQCLRFFFTGDIPDSFKHREKKLKECVKTHSYLFATEDCVFENVKENGFVDVLKNIVQREEYGFGWYDYFFFFFMNDFVRDKQPINDVLKNMHSIKGLEGKPKFCFFETRTDDEIKVEDHFLVLLPEKGVKLSGEDETQREQNQATPDKEDIAPSPLVSAFVTTMGNKQDMKRLGEDMENKLNSPKNGLAVKLHYKLNGQVVI